jgi:hypothetical protein
MGVVGAHHFFRASFPNFVGLVNLDVDVVRQPGAFQNGILENILYGIFLEIGP